MLALRDGLRVTRRLLDEGALDCVEQGYLEVLPALQAGDPDGAYSRFAKIDALARRFVDADLSALAWLGRGQALVARGDTRTGMAMLGDAMVSVTLGDVSPIAAGVVYCAVISDVPRTYFDLRRAQEWTEALNRWCDQQQGLQAFRGQCLVHRAEIMQLHGKWSEALAEAEQACALLSDPPSGPRSWAWPCPCAYHHARRAPDPALTTPTQSAPPCRLPYAAVSTPDDVPRDAR